MEIFKTLRAYVKNKMYGETYCQKILGDPSRVAYWADVYEKNKEEVKYLDMLFKSQLKGESMIHFMEKCAKEKELINMKIGREKAY